PVAPRPQPARSLPSAPVVAPRPQPVVPAEPARPIHMSFVTAGMLLHPQPVVPAEPARPPVAEQPTPAADPVEPAASAPADPPPPPPAAWAAAQHARSPADPAAARAAAADLSLLEQLEATWEDFKRDVRPRSPTVQALLNSARPYDVEGNTIVLLVSSAFHKERLEEPKNRAIIEEVLRRRLGKAYAVRCTIEEKSVEPTDLRGKIREARKDELVRAALNIFDAHIVDIEPLEPE
ncbi:MAG: DNA polymerase III subunit gamma/tau, partial [Oscillochloridaceae bacterium]|nr:DNA polymerase III subunit gamma/tau [Oscillochloridaceae bacterium]